MSILRRMVDIELAGASGADLFLHAQTKDPRGHKILSMIGPSISSRWEIRQTGASEEYQGSQTASESAEIGVEQLTLKLAKWIEASARQPTIAIDISCMSRPTMAAAFQAVLEAAKKRQLTLKVLYVLAEYSPPPHKLPPNEDICPISDWFAGWSTNATASTSLVVGLGYERDKAIGACEYFDPSETWVFVPQSSIGEYELDVMSNNKELLNRARGRYRLTTYSVHRPTEAFGILATTVSQILPRMNPVLLPFGPKIFFALNLLVAAAYPEAGVWHVTGDSDLPDAEHQASHHIPAFEVELGPPTDSVPA